VAKLYLAVLLDKVQGKVRKQGSLFSYLEYKQVTISNTWVRYRHTCSLFFDAVPISVEALIIVVDQSQSLGGKMLCPASTYQGKLTGLKVAVCCKRPELLSQ
jgi:hypothetical protein